MNGYILNSPGAVVAAVPYLIGYHPAESVVVVYLKDGMVVLTTCGDLPEGGDLEQRLETTGATSVVALGYGSDHEAYLYRLAAQAEDLGCEVKDIILVQDGRWRTLMCSDADCCPPEGQEIDASFAEHLAASLPAPAASREALTLEYVAAGAQQVEAKDRYSVDEADAVCALLASDEPDLDALTALVPMLGCIYERDYVIARLAREFDAAGWTTIRANAAAAVRAAHPSQSVAPLTFAALAAYANGDGARSNVALAELVDRCDALKCDLPNLALLVMKSNAMGVPPDSWMRMMREMDIEPLAASVRTGTPAVLTS